MLQPLNPSPPVYATEYCINSLNVFFFLINVAFYYVVLIRSKYQVRLKQRFRFYTNVAVSTVTVSAVRGSIAFLPCDIGGGNNDGLPPQPPNTESTSGTKKSKDSANAIEDRAYMVLWFKHQQNLMIRHRNSKPKNKKNPSSGGKPLYR